MLLGQAHRLLAVAGLGDDREALLLEHLPKVEPDQRLVLGDHDASGHGREATETAAGGRLAPTLRTPRLRPAGGAGRPDRPTGRANGLKHRPVWVRIPLGAPNTAL